MSDPEAQALAYIQQAESKKSKGFFGSLLGGGSSNYDQTADLYQKAANCYKIAQKFDKAGKVFEKVASVYQSANVMHEAMSSYQSAAVCYLNVSLDDAVRCYDIILGLQREQGKFTQMAKTHADLAELLESHNGDKAKICEHYQKASGFYAQENQKSSAYKYEQKYAASLASAGQYAKAADVYEKCGSYSANQSLLKYSAKDHLFHACLCYLLIDLNRAENKNKSFLEMFPLYQGTRESALITAVIEAINNEQLPDFQKALANYDSVTKLSPLCTDMFLKLKRDKFNEEEDVC